jgi:hypothetical protein
MNLRSKSSQSGMVGKSAAQLRTARRTSTIA